MHELIYNKRSVILVNKPKHLDGTLNCSGCIKGVAFQLLQPPPSIQTRVIPLITFNKHNNYEQDSNACCSRNVSLWLLWFEHFCFPHELQCDSLHLPLTHTYTHKYTHTFTLSLPLWHLHARSESALTVERTVTDCITHVNTLLHATVIGSVRVQTLYTPTRG